MTDRNLEKFGDSLNDGVAYAAKVLARMTRLAFSSRPVRVLVVEHEARPPELFPEGSDLQAGLVPLSGDLFGSAMLVFGVETATKIARAMCLTGNVASDDRAAFEESVNIFANTALAAITRDFRLSVYPAPPQSLRAAPDALWRACIEPLHQPEPRSTVALVALSLPDRRLVGRFLFVPRRDSLENLRWKAIGSADKRVEVKMGDLCVAAAPGILKVASLGSCLAVVLYDPQNKLGAIAHVMLPSCNAPELGRARPGKYADTAVDAMLKSLPNAQPARLRAWLIGGANMFSKEGPAMMQIGRRNIEMLRQRLLAAGIRSFSEETGGNAGRTVELDTSTGEVSIRGLRGTKRILPPAESKTKQQPPWRTQAPPGDG